jgi:hypothetical protein
LAAIYIKVFYALSEPGKDEGINVTKDIKGASVDLWGPKSLTAPLGAS